MQLMDTIEKLIGGEVQHFTNKTLMKDRTYKK